MINNFSEKQTQSGVANDETAAVEKELQGILDEALETIIVLVEDGAIILKDDKEAIDKVKKELFVGLRRSRPEVKELISREKLESMIDQYIEKILKL